LGLPFLHTDSGAGPSTADINSCCRVSDSVNAPDAPYRVLTIVNLALDNNGNPVELNSPVSALPTIVNCASSSMCTFSVQATDSDGDGDILRFRLATGSEDGGITLPLGLSVDSITGAVTWNTAGRPLGLYSAQIVVEARN